METENHSLAGLLDLRDHATNLLERGERAHAMGALRAGMRQIIELAAERPDLASIARSSLSSHDSELLTYIAVGAGNQITAIMSRIVAEINAQSDPMRGRGLSTPPKLDKAAAGSVRANFRPSGEIIITDDTGAIVERRQQ